MTEELQRVIQLFSFEELLDVVLPELPSSLSWSFIKKSMLKEKITFSMKTVAQFISESRPICELDQTTLNETLSVLKLFDTSYHSNRYTWTAYKLLGNEDEDPLDEEAIEKNLIRECRLSNLHGLIKVIFFNSIQWISITLKKLVKGRGLKLQKPIVFAYSHGYLFLNNKIASVDVIKALKLALGYQKVKKAKLTGKNIKSLLKYLKMKDQQVLDNQPHPNENIDHDAKTGTFTKVDLNYNFCGNKRRRKYAENVFGNDPPILEDLTIATQGCPWRGSKTLPSMVGEQIDCKVVFHSKNVFKMVQKMTERGQLISPYPNFFRRIPTLGKNEIIIRHTDSTRFNSSLA